MTAGSAPDGTPGGVTPPAAPASALLTDFYELTMLDAYYRLHMERTAVFEFFVRRLPDKRNFLIAAGLEQALDYLEGLAFTNEEIGWLRSTGRLSEVCLGRLRTFRFTGDVYAMPEGSVFFASEPILRIEAPMPEAQLVESRLLNLLQYQTLVASKAARCRIATGNASLIDFGLRRAHGAEAGLLSARASYLAGFDSTATVEAARRFAIPVAGTMAHSFIQAHLSEAEAFANFADCHPHNVVLLIDTYDMVRGAQRVARLCSALRAAGRRVQGVRIDSGDLGFEARRVRAVLDEAGCREVKIYASGGLDEYEIAALRAAGAPIDAYCVGTRMAASVDAPTLDCAYKLQQYDGRPCRKRSQWKETWPGPRQVFRHYDPQGRISIDVLGCADECVEGQSLLRPVMLRGRRLAPAPPLEDVRRHCLQELTSLPLALRSLEKTNFTPVKVSQRQHALAAEVDDVEH